MGALIEVERARELYADRAWRDGDNWRRHYDSLRLYSPARLDGLPGMPDAEYLAEHIAAHAD